MNLIKKILGTESRTQIEIPFSLHRSLKYDGNKITYLHMNIYANGDRECYMTYGDTGEHIETPIDPEYMFNWEWGTYAFVDDDGIGYCSSDFNRCYTTETCIKILERMQERHK